MNTEQRKAALIAEAEQIHRRLGAIQVELNEMAAAEHARNHASLYDLSFNFQQNMLRQEADRQAQRSAVQAEKEAAWRASQPDVMEAKRLARWETEMQTGRPTPDAKPVRR